MCRDIELSRPILVYLFMIRIWSKKQFLALKSTNK